MVDKFIDDSGNLHIDDKLIRTGYAHTYAQIDNARQVCATLRAGGFTFPGGYPIAFYTSDGGTLSFDAVRENLYQVVHSIRTECNDDWRVVGAFNAADCDGTVYCDHTNEVIHSYD